MSDTIFCLILSGVRLKYLIMLFLCLYWFRKSHVYSSFLFVFVLCGVPAIGHQHVLKSA